MTLAYVLLAVLAVVVLLVLVVVARQPAAFRVQRTATVRASAADCFALVNDFHRWDDWSPWAHRDPNMVATFGGPASGEGATYHWVGNREVGEGRMTITSSEPPGRIVIRLEFLKPFAATNTTEFTFTEDDDGHTQIIWAMSGRHGFVSKAFCMVMNMDKMVGGDFEKGLAALRAVAEGA